jgi:hypothetical protein
LRDRELLILPAAQTRLANDDCPGLIFHFTSHFIQGLVTRSFSAKLAGVAIGQLLSFFPEIKLLGDLQIIEFLVYIPHSVLYCTQFLVLSLVGTRLVTAELRACSGFP